MGANRMLQERAVLSWSQQLWKRRVLLEPGKSSEKPMFNAHLAISGASACLSPLHRTSSVMSGPAAQDQSEQGSWPYQYPCACTAVLLYMQGQMSSRGWL